MKRLLVLLVWCFAAFYAPSASAARAFSDGTFQSVAAYCPGFGSVTGMSSYVGYFTDPAEPYPRAGDVAYIRGVGADISGCLDDVIGIEFALPPGANYAVSGTSPVICARVSLDSGQRVNFGNVANQSACLQTPETGNHGGAFFGYSKVASGWYVEIRVPVQFNQQLSGQQLQAAVSTSFGNGVAYPIKGVFVAAAPPPPPQTLSVSKTGSGTVTSNPSGIYCGATCSASFTAGSNVTLTASPAAGFVFSAWSGGVCSGSSSTCTVTMNAAKSVTASFVSVVLPGSLSIGLSGLPTSSPVALTIKGPAGFNTTLSLSSGFGSSLSDVAPGSYTVSGPITVGGSIAYFASSRTVQVPSGGNASVNIVYAPVPVARDISGDRKADILWKNTDGSAAAWFMNGTAIASSAYLIGPGSGWSIKDVADFNGDGKADLLWQRTDGSVVIWLMNGPTVIGSAVIWNSGSAWTVKGVGDLNGDGKADLVWQNVDGSVVVWLMNGLSTTSSAGLLGAGTGWSVQYLADFDGDGKADILWRHSNGSVALWLMNGATVAGSSVLLGAGTGWSVKNVGDLNGDGKADLVWQHTDGSVASWLMDGASVASSAGLLGAGSGWSPKYTADFNGDGKADVLWQHSNGAVAVWLMNGASISQSATLLNGGTGWSIKGIGDYSGDGQTDIVWQHTDGSVVVWLMNGATVSSSALILAPGTGWSPSPN